MAQTALNERESELENLMDTRRQNNRLKRIIGIILSLVLIGLSFYVFNLQRQNSNILFESNDLALNANKNLAYNYRSYVRQYKETKVQLEETINKLEAVNHQLDQVSAELTTAKGMLASTQGMLAQAQDENTKLKEELNGLDDLRHELGVQNIPELGAQINVLKERDRKISTQLVELKSQLRAFQADFSNPQEGQSLIVLFQNKIKFVKNRLNYLDQQAFLAKVAAQKEKDRVALLNGNNGFIVRSGQLQNPDSTKKSFAIDVKIVQ